MDEEYQTALPRASGRHFSDSLSRPDDEGGGGRGGVGEVRWR